MSKGFARFRHGLAFTLIELLVIVLILAILTALAIPMYLRAVSDSQLRTCQANMQTIANSVQAARVEDKATDYTQFMGLVNPSLEPDLQYLPQCPSGGTYSIAPGVTKNNRTFKVVCTVHGSYIPSMPVQ